MATPMAAGSSGPRLLGLRHGRETTSQFALNDLAIVHSTFAASATHGPRPRRAVVLMSKYMKPKQ